MCAHKIHIHFDYKCISVCFIKYYFSFCLFSFFLVVFLRPGLLHAWVLLTDIYIKLNLCEEALESSLMARKLLESSNNSNKILKEILNVLEIKLLSKSSDEKDWKEALELYKKVILLIF